MQPYVSVRPVSAALPSSLASSPTTVQRMLALSGPQAPQPHEKVTRGSAALNGYAKQTPESGTAGYLSISRAPRCPTGTYTALGSHGSYPQFWRFRASVTVGHHHLMRTAQVLIGKSRPAGPRRAPCGSGRCDVRGAYPTSSGQMLFATARTLSAFRNCIAGTALAGRGDCFGRLSLPVTWLPVRGRVLSGDGRF